MTFVTRAELTEALRNVPVDTEVWATSPGDPSVGIWTAHYPIGGYAGGILYLSVTAAQPLNAGTLLSALEENSEGPAEVMAWDMELGNFDEFAQEIKSAYFVPEQTYQEDDESEPVTDKAYFEIILQD